MKIFGILILFVLGLIILQIINTKLNPVEKAGLSFPIGVSVVSFLTLIFDLTGIRVTHISLLAGIFLVCMMITGFLLLKDRKAGSQYVKLKNVAGSIDSSIISLPWLFFFGITVFVVYVIVKKAFFMPVTAHDAIAGYDFIARAIVAEGKFDTSIFDPVNPVYSIRHTYPPLVPCAFAYAYFVGFVSPKIISSLYFITALVIFYGVLIRYVSHLGAMLFTFLFATVPELLAMSAFALTNIASMLYSAFGLIYVFIWYETKENRYLILGTVLLMLGIWTRTEGVIFAAAGGVLVFLDFIKTRNWKRLITYSVCVLGIFIAWQLYLKFVLQISSSQPVIYDIFWEGEKLAAIIGRVVQTIFSEYYGITVYLFCLAVIVNLIFLTINEGYKAFFRDKAMLLVTIFVVFSLYILIFYQLDIYEDGELVGTWVRSGYKRGFFNYIPLLLFYSATNQAMKSFFNKLE